MVDEKFREEEPTEEQPANYEAKKTLVPEREVDVGEGEEHKSLAEKEAESPNLTDLQTSLKRLFPKFQDIEIDKIAQASMVARIFPDTYMPLLRMTVISLLEKHAPTEDIDIIGTISLVNAAMSIGLDGKGRIDALELAGSAKDSEEIERLSKGLGF